MWQAREEPGADEPGVVGSRRGEHIAHGERDHKADEEGLARPRRPEHGQQRSADNDPRRIRRDRMARARDADADPRRNLGQQPHGHEFGGPDGDATEDEREGGEGGMRLGH